MQRLSDLPIRHKLTLISLLTTTLALLLACAGFVAYELLTFKNELVGKISSVAEVIAYNSAAALSFNDAGSAEQTLRALGAEKDILAACIYDRDGRIFAVYRPGKGETEFAPPPAGPTQRFGTAQLDLFRPIIVAGDKVGTIYFRADLAGMRERLQRYALIIGAIMVMAILMAYFIASRLQRMISAPVADLVAVASRVTVEENYSIRAIKTSNDELGRLIDSFNGMLGQIQARDHALHAANDSLEQRVEDRTRELKQENAERKRAEANLANSLSLLHATLESTADGILVVDREGRVSVFNRKFAEMWRIPPDALASHDDERTMNTVLAQLQDPEEFVRKVRELYAQPDTESFDVIAFKDGRVFERYSQSQQVEGATVGRVWCFRDITERKRSEAELAQAQRELLESSRQAGMAEVATGVLHNVGNVLNSVNVSATLVANHVRNTKAVNIAKVATMFDAHAGDLAGFLTHDARGQKIIAYLGQLGAMVVTEQQTMMGELDHLRKNIEHIKEIVTMQQSYATNSGFSEPVSLADLVEETLRMSASSYARHNVEIVRDFKIRPTISTDKHKIVQILINVMRNAMFACDESGRTDKRITVGIADEPGWLQIIVVDNGVGIPAENLTRIFNHGFTTRKNGHGFGLHSCALAAKQLGGSLGVASAGRGHGATFTLKLPRVAAAACPANAVVPPEPELAQDARSAGHDGLVDPVGRNQSDRRQS